MKQWDTWQWSFPHGDHPCVILSNQDRIDRAETVNVLGCSSHRSTRLPRLNEVMLNGPDGMDWETLCRCDVIWLVPKSELKRHRGTVSTERRRELGRKVIQLFGLYLD